MSNEKKPQPGNPKPKIVLPKIVRTGEAQPVPQRAPNGGRPPPEEEEPVQEEEADELQGTGQVEYEPEPKPRPSRVTPICANCVYFVTPDRDRLTDGTPLNKVRGNCRIHAPAPLIVVRQTFEGPAQIVDGFFPPVVGDVWCGDWKIFPKEPPH